MDPPLRRDLPMKRTFFFLMAAGIPLLFLGFWTDALGTSTGGAPTTMCMDCHIMPKGAEIKVDKLPKSFQPGSTYEMTVKVESAVPGTGDIRGGFAVSASDGELIVADSENTQKSDQYITHTAEGTQKRSWKFKWQAPKEKKSVTLNVSVIAANGDFAPANDGFARREYVIHPQ